MSELGNPGLSLHLILLTAAFPLLVAALALWRVWLAQSHSRFWAVLALVFAVLPLVFVFGSVAPDGLGTRYMALLEDVSSQAGWLVFALPMSIPLALSGLARGRTARWVDAVHILALLVLVLFWRLGL